MWMALELNIFGVETGRDRLKNGVRKLTHLLCWYSNRMLVCPESFFGSHKIVQDSTLVQDQECELQSLTNGSL